MTAIRCHRIETVADSGIAYALTRTTWHQQKDHPYFYEPLEQIKAIRLEQLGLFHPTIEDSEMEIDPGFGRNLEERLRAIQLPIPNRALTVGLDGEVWTVRFGDSMVNATYRWWCKCPQEWQPLEGLVADIWHFVMPAM